LINPVNFITINTKSLSFITEAKASWWNRHYAAVQNALLKWGNSVCSDDPPQRLEQIGERIMELKIGIKTLNSSLYGNHQNGNSLEELKNDFVGCLLQR